MKPDRFLLHAALAALLLIACTLAVQSDETLDEALPDAAAWLRTQPLTDLWIISGTARCWRFRVWVARTPEQFSRGLMYVRQLEQDGGMLFAMQSERDIAMWMRNTYIPLDILFADARGTIIKIHADATPLSLDEISSGAAAYAVVEIPGGTAAQRGIMVGDRLRHAHFGNTMRQGKQAEEGIVRQ